MGPLGNTNCLRSADACDLRLERAIVIEDLDALVAAVGDVDVALSIDSDAVRRIELAVLRAFGAPGLEERSVLRELGDASIAVAVGDEDVASGIEGDVSRTIEAVAPNARAHRATTADRRRRRCTPAFSTATSTGGCRSRTAPTARINCFRLAPHHHRDAALRVELDHLVAAAIDDPDVVLRVDADGLGNQETVHTNSHFAKIFSV